MRIEIAESEERKATACKIETRGSVDIYDCFTGVGFLTDAGLFGVAERDGGIEVMLNGKTVYAHSIGGPIDLDIPAICPRCEGCGKIASGEGGAPWSQWANLPLESAGAVMMGMVKPIDCPACGGTGVAQ